LLLAENMGDYSNWKYLEISQRLSLIKNDEVESNANKEILE
jgi:hypothetical protein